MVAELTRSFSPGKDVQAGPGDDCAVIGAPRASVWSLLKADALVEGIHFLPSAEARQVGWKAMARPISDIAAMGGVPQRALVTMAIPGTCSLAWLLACHSGMQRAAKRFGVTIVGGETTRSPGGIFLSIALQGFVERKRCVYRSGGRAGDILYVTGRLGGSLAGKHLRFVPRVEEARWLTENFHLRAMMDLSDGLGSDLPRLAARQRHWLSLG